MKYILLQLATFFCFIYSLPAQQMYVLSAGNRILEIADITNPAEVGAARAVSGISAAQNLVAIDMQPGTGELFALAYEQQVSEAQLYTIDVTVLPYVAIPVNDPFPLSLGTQAVAGFDINPLNPAEIYLTATDGSIYILDASAGNIAFTSGSIFYEKYDVHAAVTPAITGIAFSNNYWGADNAHVVGYDITTNTLVQFDSYTGATIHTLGQSSLNLNAGLPIGFDSRFDTGVNGNVFYMAARPAGAGGYSLFRLDANTGTAEVLGTIGNGSLQVNDIAVDIGIADPGPVLGQIITALTRSRRQLIFFDSYKPGVIRDVKSITGITPGQTVMAIDYRPLDLDLYALAYDPLPQEYQLYRIDVNTGAAIPVSTTPQIMDMGISDDTWASFDFNPLNDRVHVVSSNGASFHINPTTGAVTQEDDKFIYAPADVHSGDISRVGSIAYTSSYINSANSLRLGIDLASRTLVNFTGASLTTLNTLAGINVLDTGAYTNAYIDLYYDPATRADVGYLAVNTKAYSSSSLYYIDTRNGNTSLLGPIGPGIPVADIAVQPTYTGTTVSAGDIPLGAEGIYLYPNPVNSQANIILPAIARQRVSVSILDFNGNIMLWQVYKPGGNQVTLDVSALPNGMYSLRVQEYGYPVESIRLVKQ